MPRLTDAPRDVRQFFAQQLQSADHGSSAERIAAARSATSERFAAAGAHITTVAQAYTSAADPLRLAEQELAALGAELGVSSAALPAHAASGLAEAVRVARPLAAATRPARTVTSLLTGALGPREDRKLLSLSMLDVESHVLANPVVAQRHVDNYSDYTACHDIAHRLNRILGTGDPKIAKGAAGIELAQEAIASRDAVVQVQYKHPKGDGHSFTLVSTPASVESLEGWAGVDARYAFGLHECLFGRPRTDIAHDAAIAALGDVLTPHRGTRSAALDVLSRAGLGGFEARYPADQMELTVTVRRLDRPERIEAEMDRRVGRARELVATTAALTNPDVPVGDLQAALAAAEAVHDEPSEAQIREVLAARGDAAPRIDAIVRGLTALGLL